MSTATSEFDSIDLDSLRSVGGLKWTRFPDTIGMFVAEMDFGTAPAVRDAMHRAIDDGLLGYLPPTLVSRLGEATAAWQRDRYGWDVPAGRVRPVGDVLTALRIVIEQFSAAGSKIVLPTPAYMPFLTIPPSMGREIVEVPMLVEDGRYSLDLDGIEAAFADGAGLLILCNPYNPVGRVFDREELEAVASIVERHGGRVFSDEIHAPLVYAGASHIPYASLSTATAAHTVTATSPSKAWNMPGVKCAQVILSNDADAEVWATAFGEGAPGASTIGVVANIAAYEEGGSWLDEVTAYLDENRRTLGEDLAEQIPGIRYTMPEGTYIAWLDCRDLPIEGSVAAFFREHAGVALTDGIDCGGPGEGFVRMIFATPRPILREAVRRMAAALAA
ncbi:MalY/PatB family protein [Microbacterium nymphoidis]|uniref:MalY/PatB family protein n=1 Tax=Microbacterium nymphoidis TaxID=2898586 RepID=UPI001E2F1F67|nr:aminotransferase class I/II-fold pyridoxal phosphate-dependent enzyme [Microbacterium nymphoidis]MCD2499596.1 aminotransferase class I/II-fold pyridoxal phosphate-dependent enzyme [Microbacterium nymphoidis]